MGNGVSENWRELARIPEKKVGGFSVIHGCNSDRIKPFLIEYPMESGIFESQRRENLADSDPYVKFNIEVVVDFSVMFTKRIQL
jgi:hypothetical protein